jgi:hypothetical protein
MAQGASTVHIYWKHFHMTEHSKLHKVWVYQLAFPFRYGKLAASLLIFVMMWALLIGESSELGFYAKLFFAAMCAYIVPTFGRIVDRSVATFDEIEGMLLASPEECARWRLQLTHRSSTWLLAIISGSVFVGICNIIMAHPNGAIGLLEDIDSGRGEYMTYMLTILVWVTLTTAIGALIGNAQLFGKLGRRMRIDLLQSPALLSVARVAILSTLSVIGAQTFFVLLILDTDAIWLDILPGFVATTLTVLALFLLPVWPLHERLQAAKQTELAEINHHLECLRPEATTALDDTDGIDQVNRLLLYRREIQQVSEWPFDIPALTQLGLYLIIPPLTWVASAFIEKLVDMLV